MKAVSSIGFFPIRKKVAVTVLRLAGVACLLSACASRSQFQKGYDRGAADIVKRQYWILQNMQKPPGEASSPSRTRLYRLPVAPDPNSSVKTVPYEIAIPIVE